MVVPNVKNRAALESLVREQLRIRGYVSVDKSIFAHSVNERPIYSEKVIVGENIYGLDRKCHFILYHPEKWKKKLVIEVRWQGQSGSTDEKFPFIVMNVKRSDYETIMVLGGKKLRPEVKDWVRAQTGYRLIGVFDPAQFQSWGNQGNL